MRARFLIGGLVALLAVGTFTACAAWDPSHADGKTAAPEVRLVDNRYYYYAEAQILRQAGKPRQALELMQEAARRDPQSALLKREIALLYLQLKDEEAAIRELRATLAQHPDDVESMIILGRLLQSRGKQEEAIALYEDVIAQDKTQEDIYLLLGNLYIQNARWADAQRVFTQLTEAIPSSYAGYYFLGTVYRKTGDRKAAEAAYRQALALEPELESARFELIELYQEAPPGAARNRKIERLFEELIDSNPDNMAAVFGYALYRRDRGQEAKARKLLATLMQSADESELIRNLFRLYLEKERYADAVYLIERLIPNAKQPGSLQYLLGVAYAGLERNREAIAAFAKVPPQNRFYHDAMLQVAKRYAAQEQYAKAVELMKQALKQDPQNVDFLYLLGVLYEEQKQYAQAESYLQQALAQDPANENAQFKLGVIFDKMGRKQDCIAAMRRVLEINPEHANAMNYLGYTFAEMGTNLDEAEALVHKALELRPDDGYITDSLGWIYYKKGQYPQALETLLKAATLTPDDPTILEHVGDAYLKNGERAKALEYYRRSRGLRKDDIQAIQKKIDALGGNGS